MNRGRNHRLVEYDLELLTKFGTVRPLPVHFDDFSRHGSHEISDHTDKILQSRDLYLGNGVAILFVFVCDPLNLFLKFGEHAFLFSISLA
jgi:hypothetical protein